MIKKITVVGAGSWGTALAKMLAEKGEQVTLWAHEAPVAQAINRHHRNPLYLQDVSLPTALTATDDFTAALKNAVVVVSVVPSHVVRAVWSRATTALSPTALFVSCTKGIEVKSFQLMHHVLAKCLPHHPERLRVTLSGPSFASDVARGLPTSVVIAGKDERTTKRAQALFRTSTFLPFTGDDVVGVEVGGAVKNVIALASGMGDGLELGHSARAMIITRGLYEMIKVGTALGARHLTFAGLSGVGDLILTATSPLSRNYRVGLAIGAGRPLTEALGKTAMVAEGVMTARAVVGLAKRHHLSLPICTAVQRIIDEGLAPRHAVAELTALPLENEFAALLTP